MEITSLLRKITSHTSFSPLLQPKLILDLVTMEGCKAELTPQSYVDRVATGVGAVAELAAERKAEKYHNSSSDHIFQPIAMENSGAFSSSSLEFLRELGRRLGSLFIEERQSCFLFQCLSVAIQRFNSVLLHNGFIDDIPPEFTRVVVIS